MSSNYKLVTGGGLKQGVEPLDIITRYEQIPTLVCPTAENGAHYVARQVAKAIQTKRLKGEKFVLFPPTEIVPDGEYFDYDAKYNGRGQEITPARISPIALERLYESMKTIYDALGMRSLVRIDFIVRDDIPYFIEVNTVPGMSPASLIPQQAKAMGLSATELFDMIIDQTLQA